ncbi:phosphate ABC transporter substrate-binding protein [Oribacterium sp. P9]|uniref:phosphate ABC transporter substrate-binding protein n=1 Tax=unclassified Oribacterium TaxID=2629782 RepID=UPI002A76F6CE|nr:phosphate ABC transporter substrate-binding protein [Oribacterium sp.]MDD6519574.1 phosphate ABC transporter substrate-binding protein [Oribacterium sp.]MDY2854325.1 phosphate ABC transporter substrate-binding protein [Oliverpabstia sp.]
MELRRILAILALVIIAFLLVAVLYFAVTGANQYLLACLFCLVVVPVVIYIFIWFTKLTNKK